MNTEVINKKIKKISLLLDTFEDGVQISVLERDLLLSYIKELYDVVLDSPVQKAEFQEDKKGLHTAPEFLSEKFVKAPSIVQHHMTEENLQVAEERSIPVVQIPEKKEITPETVISPVTKPAQRTEHKVSKISLSPEVMDEIFKEEKVSELSDKLSMSHIDDIRKGLGLNERLFTQKELFGDNSSHFNEVLDHLNKLSSYDEAKSYLLDNVIPVYHWDSKGKIKKAATFIKLVKRRFI